MRSIFRPLRLGTWEGPTTPDYMRRSRYTFKANYTDTLHRLDHEIDLLGASEYVIEADFTESDIRLDGMPKANARQPQFPGVRIFFESHHGPLVYQADNCAYWQHNVRSIALGLEALRAVDRYGITHRAEQYTGFRSIGSGPATPMQMFYTSDEAMSFLLSEEVVGLSGADGLSWKTAWRHITKLHHPDAGNSGLWPKIDAAKQLLEKEGRWPG